MADRKFTIIAGKSSTKVACLGGISAETVIAYAQLTGNHKSAERLKTALPNLNQMLYIGDDLIYIKPPEDPIGIIADLIIFPLLEETK